MCDYKYIYVYIIYMSEYMYCVAEPSHTLDICRAPLLLRIEERVWFIFYFSTTFADHTTEWYISLSMRRPPGMYVVLWCNMRMNNECEVGKDETTIIHISTSQLQKSNVPVLYCIVLHCIVLYRIALYWRGGHCCPNPLRPFQIYCAPQNSGVTRTWICRLTFAQRPIFSGLRFFNESEISDSESTA